MSYMQKNVIVLMMMVIKSIINSEIIATKPENIEELLMIFVI